MLWGQENLPRIAFVTLPPARVHISVPATGSSGLIYCGLGLNLGDVVFHGLGERTHQRTIGEGNWCFIVAGAGTARCVQQSSDRARYQTAIGGPRHRACARVPPEHC